MVVMPATTLDAREGPRANADATITVAVCTRDRTAQLCRLLDALAEQCGPSVEMLVVDNAPSTPGTRDLVRDHFSSVRYLLEPVPGLDFARNCALRHASGSIVAFIDDDAVPASDWLATISAVFAEREQIAICTGQVRAMSLDSDGARLFEASGGLQRGERRIHLPPGRGRWPVQGPRPLIAWASGAGVGCSLAIRRHVGRALGGFDVALDQGPLLPGGGDIDMLWRVLAAGHQVVYEPRVKVWHEHRREPAAAECQILGHDRAFMAVLAKALTEAAPRDKPAILAFIVWRLLKPLWRLLRRLAHPDPLSPRMLTRRLTNTWRGLFAYPAGCRLAQQRQRQFGSAESC
jgi:GT2 family glycosyltransferase